MKLHVVLLAALLVASCTEPPPAKPAVAPALPVAPPQALDTKTLCADNAILLTQHSFDSLQAGGYCKLCKKFDESACELDWPFSDVPSCKAYDEMRNGIFAFYGRTFDSEEWRAFFAKKSWYKPDPAFTEARLSAIARANIAYLKRAATEKIGCAD
jgi:hypothetical protein